DRLRERELLGEPFGTHGHARVQEYLERLRLPFPVHLERHRVATRQDERTERLCGCAVREHGGDRATERARSRPGIPEIPDETVHARRTGERARRAEPHLLEIDIGLEAF